MSVYNVHNTVLCTTPYVLSLLGSAFVVSHTYNVMLLASLYSCALISAVLCMYVACSTIMDMN